MQNIQLTVDIVQEDNVWTAICRDIDVASQGATIEEAKKNFHEAITLWLDTASEEEVQATLPPWTYGQQERYTTQVEVQYGQAQNPIGI